MALSSPVQPQVSIILPCRNERGHIAACLASILNQMAPEGGFEVIVADGMSDDGTREIIRQLMDHKTTGPQEQGTIIRLIDNPGRIVSSGLNAAIRAARGDIIIRMDAHTEYAPDYIQNCVEVLESNGADNVGGPGRTKAESYMQKAIAAAYHSALSVGGARFHNVDYEGPVDTVPYGCWRKSSFERFGHFDEDLVRNQDDEHNLRIIRGGGRIYQSPKIKSWYRPRGSLSALFKQYLQYGYWKVRVVQKHKLPASWRHLVPGAFVLTLFVLFLLSASCFLFSGLVRGPWAVVHSLAHFTFLLSTFCFVSAISAYSLCVLAVSLLTAAKTKWKLLPVLPFVFPCFHFGYGYGFLRGIWDFMIRKKRPGKQFAVLTR
jgi:succinoglycan biosynthesis protein ExoA